MKKFVFSIAIIGLFFSNLPSAMAADLEVSGWIPYWAVSSGTRDARSHLSDLDAIYPFAFSVKEDGTLHDLAGLSKTSWKRLFTSARSKDIEIIPTVMWSNGQSIDRVLQDEDSREDHIRAITSMVRKGKYDGVNIDYESKLSVTKDAYSAFLKELKDELGSKTLTCTVEARTPPDSLYKVVPATIEYANDYKAIGRYCDRVEIMAYDQQRADLKLNEARSGEPYFPVSDTEWVRKVVVLAVQSIPKDKIILGIPTYGYHYEVTVAPNWYQSYSRIGALNQPDLLDIADEYEVTPGRAKSGEIGFTYFPKSSPYRLLESLPVPSGTRTGNEAAAQALLFANVTGQNVPVRYATWSDAESVKQKVDLAEEFGLRGVALFKIDGEEDEDIWDVLGN